MARLGRSVVAQTPDADDVTVTAIVGDQRAREDQGDHGRRLVFERELTIPTDTSAGGLAEPRMDMTFVIDGSSWSVSRIETRSNSTVRLTVARREMVEKSRPQYRSAV